MTNNEHSEKGSNHECPRCNGDGTVIQNVGPFFAGPSYPEDCPECNGTGEVDELPEMEAVDWKAIALEEADS